MGDETKLRRDETIFGASRKHPETGAGYQMVNETTGRKGPRQGTVMIKAVSAIAIAAFIAAALSILPGFAPQVEASVPSARQGRPAGHPPGWPRLLAAGLAEFRSFLPARRRQKRRVDQGSPAGNRRPHAVRAASPEPNKS